MNGYPYPVLTETDSAYNDKSYFSIEFLKHKYSNNKVSLYVNVSLNSKTLREYVMSGNAELVIKAVTDIRVTVFHFDEIPDTIELELDSEDIRFNDTIKLTAFFTVKSPFTLFTNEEISEDFGHNYKIDLRKGDILAISNTEKLNYNTTSNDFVMIKSSADMEGKGFKIRLSKENHIEILVGPKFKYAYATFNNLKAKPIFNSHIVFEAFVYTLVEIAQQKEDYSNKEWYRLFSQAFEITGDTIEDFKQKAIDDGVDISYIYEVAQMMISNSIETTIIRASEQGE